MRIIKGDEVKIISGRDKGRQGKVTRVFPQENKIVVAGLNLRKKHIKARQAGKKGEVVAVAMPLSAAKAMVVCKYCAKATRIGYQINGDKKARVCKKCGQAL